MGTPAKKEDKIADVEPFEHINTPKKRFMLEALEKYQGIVTIASRESKVSRRAHYYWLQEDEDYRKAYEEICEVALDEAEHMLHKRMKKSDSLLIFYLKTKGKERGYIERQENINMNQTFVVEVPDEPIPDDIPTEIDVEQLNDESE